ncbi:MAG: phenylalanine--tRNA ligase subunit beta [Dethiobacter sp.]|jgi:phenylalanyl-tRNA synthetase beta chain|nr:phenylalanine--tRNA ligase subunit beta [Dethiobacter sp.]MBS3983718.1 phenylalanine--tRNA ligase subunit beta [Dethiobacter sp.]
MRVPYTWLKDFIEIELTAKELADVLTNAGIEVEEITTLSVDFSGVVVAEVLTVEKHPEADKLFVVQVWDGEEEHTVVAGIANLLPGERVPLAKPGAVLPGNLKIKRTRLRGVESAGMLCSAAELGLALNPNLDGILVLDKNTPLGQSLTEALYLTDPILVLGLTPNRADCLGLLGVAYEVASLTGKLVQMPNATADIKPLTSPPPKISIKDQKLCARYSGLVVRNVRVGLSPVWMQVRLLQAGVRPINNIVDVTNYVMWEWGQPLHAFDYSTLTEGRIEVRLAFENEVLVTLDKMERPLTGEMLVIADALRPIAIAGVMGGLETEVTEETTSVLLESAHFDPTSIRRTGRSLGLYSEAQQRFEKGVDVNGCTQAIQRASRLIELLGAGYPDGEVVDEYVAPRYPQQIRLRPERARKLIGLEISQLEMALIFRRQGFSVGEGTQLHVTVPTRRPDLQLEVDLIEEVARIHGYHKIGSTLPAGAMTQGRLTDRQQLLKKTKQILQSCGFAEVINYSFVSRQDAEKLQIPADSRLRQAIPLANPLSEEQSVMRTQLVSGLLSTINYNKNRNQHDLKLFELGSVYFAQELTEGFADERTVLGIAITGAFPDEHWQQKPLAADFFDIKGTVETVLARLGSRPATYLPAEISWCQPGQSASILLAGEEVGWLGRIHPNVADSYDFDKPVYLAELDLQTVLTRTNLCSEYVPLPRYPAMLRDMAIVVPDAVSAAEVINLIREAGGLLVEEVNLFDLYRGPQIPAGSRSLAFAVKYRDKFRTLSDEVVARQHQNIEEALSARFSASLRR